MTDEWLAAHRVEGGMGTFYTFSAAEVQALRRQLTGCCGVPACDVVFDQIGNCTTCGYPTGWHPQVASQRPKKV